MILSGLFRQFLGWIGLIVIAGVLWFAATSVTSQLVVFALVIALAFLVQSSRRTLVLAACLVCCISLVRRLLSDSSGHTAFDPLVLLPFALVLLSLVFGSAKPQKLVGAGRWIGLAAIAVVVSSGLTIALRGAFDGPALYLTLSLVVPVVLVANIASQRVANVWPAVERALVPLSIACGLYGVVQFFVLPQWDRAWMVSSNLKSIGQPLPLEVRVFGASEAPATYASLIGLAVVIFLCRAVLSRRPLVQLLWFVGCVALSVPLVLSGVRSALVAVLICSAILFALRGRGASRIIPVGLVIVVGLTLSRIVAALGGSSGILNDSRYLDFNTSTDVSFQARLGLARYLNNPLSYLVGTPADAKLDNLPLSVMVGSGLIASLGVCIVFIVITLLALKNLAGKVGEVASLAALFIVVMSFTMSTFNSSFGILVGIIFGAVYLAHQRGAEPLSVPFTQLTNERPR